MNGFKEFQKPSPIPMNGPFSYTQEEIGKYVAENKMGSYRLSNVDDNGNHVVGYVGRSDTDLHGELVCYLGEKEYTHFWFAYAASTRQAFEQEATDYHAYEGQIENKVHPGRPDGDNGPCPVEGCFTISRKVRRNL